MFKIVQTTENNRIKLIVVPSGWEKNGELSWPKFKTDKLIKDPKSVPDNTWFKMRCKLKRDYLLNQEIADEELDRMLDKDETDPEEKIQVDLSNVIQKKRARVIFPNPRKNSNVNDFNSFAESCLASDESPILVAPPKEPQRVMNIISHNLINNDNENIYLDQSTAKHVLMEGIEEIDVVPQKEYNMVLKDITNTNGDLTTEEKLAEENESTNREVFECESNATLNEKLDTILANQAVITSNQIIIMNKLEQLATKENQDIIMKELAKIETMIELVGTQTSCEHKSNKTDIKRTTINTDIETIHDLKSLSELEQKLEDKQIMEEYITKLGYICGTSGNGNGINNAYTLVDRLFDRQFMTLCSWAGGARDKREKIALKVFKNVINLFAKVVRLSDDKFTLANTEEFLKNVLRNSTRRSACNLSRCSSVKRRPKKLCYQEKGKAENVTIEITENVQANENEELTEQLVTEGLHCSDVEESVETNNEELVQ